MKKIVSQNLAITIISKIVSFLSFIYIAKILTESEYGVFIYITMIISLLPLLQFGSMNGTMILLPKYINDINKNAEKLFFNYNILSLLVQFVSSIFLFILDINISSITIFIVALTFLIALQINNSIMYLNSKHEFEKVNFIKLIDQILKPFLVLLTFYFYKSIDSIFYGQLFATIISFLASLYFLKFDLIVKKFYYSEFIIYVKDIYKIGFFIYLTWAIDILFRTADKWFISQFYSLKELAAYGFTSSLAMNVWLLAMSFFTPYSQVLYKHVAEKKFIDVKNIVESTNKNLYILLLIISVIAILAYPVILEFIIKKYFGTELLFFVLVVSSIFLSINNMYIYYMISNNFHFILLRYQSAVLILNLMLNGVFAFLHLDILYYSYSTIVSLVIYFILVRRYFYIDIAKKLESLDYKDKEKNNK